MSLSFACENIKRRIFNWTVSVVFPVIWTWKKRNSDVMCPASPSLLYWHKYATPHVNKKCWRRHVMQGRSLTPYRCHKIYSYRHRPCTAQASTIMKNNGKIDISFVDSLPPYEVWRTGYTTEPFLSACSLNYLQLRWLQSNEVWLILKCT